MRSDNIKMKILIIIISIFTLAIASNYEDLNLRYKFNEFVKKYNKRYSSGEEYKDRLNKFAQNLKDIAHHNAMKDKTWTKGINQFADLTGDFINDIFSFRSTLFKYILY